MSLRFRHTFQLLPGARINLSGAGVSASFGVPGATLNVGPHGVRGTIGLPGTGLSYSTQLASFEGVPSAPSAPSMWTPPPSPAPEVTSGPMRRIESGALASRTSPALVQLKTLVVAAREQRAEVEAALKVTRADLVMLRAQLRWRSWPALRWFLRKRVHQLRHELIPRAETQQTDLRAWLEASVVRVEFAVGDEAQATWAAVEAAFRTLSSSSSIWDVTADADVDRVRTRSAAARSVDRKLVHFGFATDPTLQLDAPTPRLGNVNGEAVHLYPALAVTPGDGDFALISFNDLHLRISSRNFVEDGSVPADAEVVGKTWEKVNKDGSRDRRFANNRQLPLCRYGELKLSTATGLNEEWEVSNWKALVTFAETWQTHVAALDRASVRLEDILKSNTTASTIRFQAQ